MARLARRGPGQGALDLLDERAIEAQWAAAVVAPPGAGFRVLVACDGPTVVGVVSVAPVPAPEDRPFDAPGGAILALEVEPARQRVGHGSRLLAAAVDTLREDGADQVHTWVLDGDEARARFLASAGLGPDDVARELDLGADARRVDAHGHRAPLVGVDLTPYERCSRLALRRDSRARRRSPAAS